MNRFVRRIGDTAARHPWKTIGVWAALAALVVVLSGAAGGAFADRFSAKGSESAEAVELLEERFPAAAGGPGVVVFAAPDGQTLDRSAPAIAAALAQVAAVEHVAVVGDPFTTGGVSADGRTGYADLTLDIPASDLGADGAAAVVEALGPAREAGLQAELGGEAASYNKVDEKGKEGLGVLAALVVLLVAFGTVAAALVPIVVALVAVGAGLSAVVLLASALDVSTAAPTFGAMVGLGVGIDYALFVVARYRDNRAAGQADRVALSAAMGSSGTAVLFAGLTVVVAMAALVLTGIGVLATIGLATAIIVLFAVATALTLLPALLSLLGSRIDAGRLPGRRRVSRPVESTVSWRLAHSIAARPWPYLVAASVVLLTLAAPALSLESEFPNAGSDTRGSTQRQAHDLMAEGFGPGSNAPMLVVADLRDGALTPDGVDALAQQIAADPGILEVGDPRASDAGDTVVLQAVPTTGPSDDATSATLQRLRALTPDGVLVTGTTALQLDLDQQLSDALPLFVGSILVVSFLLLMVVFRSVTVPLKAAAMNLLSIGGAYGVVVAVFQWGWFGGLLGLDETYRVASFFPTLFFAVLFGLSMDYEVFLVSRIREAYTATGDTTEAVARGLAATSRVITSGALIMLCVFLGFVTNPDPMVKMIGVGLAAAIAIDATVVRMVLVPATMALMGRANWWLPSWLDRLLPHLDLEDDGDTPVAVRIPQPAQPAQPADALAPAGT